MNKTPLSVLIIAENEEKNIRECLRSVEWADDIIVVDGGSKDATVQLAKQYTDKVLSHPWQGFSEAKRFGLQHCTNEWVLWLDADERVPEGLAGEIQSIVTSNESAAAFAVARRAYFLGKWIRHCGWYPGYVNRLFRKSRCRISEHKVHEQLIVDGEIKHLKNDLLHYTDNDLEHYFKKFNEYTSLAADEIVQKGGSASIIDLLIRPPFTFFRMYILRAGVLDGFHGLLLCMLSAFYVFVKYAKVWQRKLVKHT
ncbi:MAG TPA: glycosyltransferase family 2 protein [Candidatus Kapabacteria bacterium]|nr:glycosyltransferase family 2 protein [Candidatus Kapabacteria bacterium]